MKITGNISEVIAKNISRLKDLGDTDKTTRILAFDTVALVSDRIQQRGEKTDGTPIQTSYSNSYARKRDARGLQTNFVDLTFTGDMIADFLPVKVGADWGAGFISDGSAQKAEYNERRFGEVFKVSENELNILEKSLKEIIKGLIK